ncbi:hypothetical protein FSARC_13203 [Fusarium sarcochroum]|uniref:DNA2/NAM7 helicase-like C-terminal domain-containing protein n=1 Tax=Fusarium sarcochroum TaxID=1208366 RepID=A0A8H4T3A5_9HYPO|nr:hypothetical protein FSARC_13203 [Fusarium sarcochroum]
MSKKPDDVPDTGGGRPGRLSTLEMFRSQVSSHFAAPTTIPATHPPEPQDAPMDDPASTEMPTDPPKLQDAPMDDPASTETPTDPPEPQDAPMDDPASTDPASTETPTDPPKLQDAPMDDPASVGIQPLASDQDIVEDLAEDVSPDSDRVGQLGGPDNDDFGMNRQKSSQTGWIHTLVDINDVILPGFANETVQRLGLGPFKGLHVRVNIEMGPYVKPAIKLQFVVRHMARSHMFAEMIIPLDYLVDKPHIVDVDSTDETSLKPLLTHVPMNLAQLCSSQTVTDPFSTSIINHPDRPALDIINITSTVRTLRVDVSFENVIVIKSSTFKQERENHPEAVCSIADAVLDRLSLQNLVSITLWLFPDKSFTGAWWNALDNISPYVRPYAGILKHVRKNYTDLSYGNLSMDDLEHPAKPVPSTNVFLDGEQQTVSLMTGAVEEITLADELADKLWKSDLQAIVIQDPYSVWEPKEDDLQTYGVIADRQPLRWYFIVDLSNGVADLMPDVDTAFYIYPRVQVSQRVMPTIGFSSEQVRKVTHDLTRNLRLAEDKGEMAERRCHQEHEKASEAGHQGKAERLAEQLQTVRDRVYQQNAASILFGMLREPSREAIEEQPRVPLNVQLAATAQTLAGNLRQKSQESDLDWHARVHAFVRENGPGRPRLQASGFGEGHLAIRRDLPAGTPADVALLEVLTANQSNWPMGLKKPPLPLVLPTTKIIGSMHEFIANLWQPVKDKPATTTINDKAVVNFKAWFSPDDTTIKAECAAVTEINGLGNGTPAKDFWDWSCRFPEKVVFHDWHKQYPALGRKVETNAFNGERHDVLSRLDKVPYGFAAITGGPGSGKTTLAEDIVLLVISEPCMPVAATAYPPLPPPQDPPPAEASGQETDVDASFAQGYEGESDNEESDVDESDVDKSDNEESDVDESDVDKSDNEESDVDESDVDKSDNEESDVDKSDVDDSVAPSDVQEVQPVEPDTTLVDSGEMYFQNEHSSWLTEPVLAAAWEDTPLDTQNEPASDVQAATRAVWIVADNQLCADAQARLCSKKPDAIILRARPWKSELRNMFEASARQPKLIEVKDGGRSTHQDRRLAEHINHQMLRFFNASSASQGPDIVSEYSKQFAFDNPEQFPDYINAWNQKFSDPEAFSLNRVENEQHARDLLIHVITNRVDVLCCTPVTFGQVCNHTGLRSSFIVLDEANRMTESLSAIPMSKCPDASFLLIGDVKQFGPRATSLFERMEKSGTILYTLKANHRARGNAVDFVREKFYDGKMMVVNKKATPATTGILNYITSKTGVYYQNLMIDIPEAQETKVGTSYCNSATARFSVQLAIQLYREAVLLNTQDADDLQNGQEVNVRRGSILIVTMYSVQKREIELLLRQATVAELQPGLVEVRTADGSLSHKAAVVIVDTVRTGKRGFIDDPRRVAVTFSRAELMTIFVARAKSIPERTRLGSLVTFLKERDAVHSLGTAKSRPQWTIWCSRCLQPGHVADKCKQTLQCTTCGESHATRYCPRVEENAISQYANDPITADDGVARDVFVSSGISNSEGKRVAFRKQNRASRKPPATVNTQIRSDYREAARSLRQTAEEQAAEEDEE